MAMSDSRAATTSWRYRKNWAAIAAFCTKAGIK
jgi:hypothetical protein